jgi:hypothetical protein
LQDFGGKRFRASISARAAVVGALALALCLVAAPSAFAAASYVFEPTLSLTGNCTTSALDGVPDPGPCPGTAGVDHPSAGFKSPSVTTDAYGDIYVVNVIDKESRIDIFNPEGFFISEFKDPAGAQSIAVDADGNMYLFERLQGGERQVRRIPPTVYKPKEEEIEYGGAPVILTNESTKELIFPLGPESSLDVDRSTGRVYFDNGFNVSVFGSAAEENKLLEENAIETGERSTSIAIDSVHKKVWLSVRVPVTHKTVIKAYELEAPHEELKEDEINGSTTPKGEFISGEGFLAIDVDDDTGHVFVGDLAAAKKVYEFEEDGTYLATIEHSFEIVPFEEIAVDDGEFSPHPQTDGWLFVPSHPSPSLGHVFVFEPKEQGPPIVEEASVSDVTETEATLRARIDPNGLVTPYRFEYVTQQQFETSGFAEATIAKEDTLSKSSGGASVSVAIAGLTPETSYRFRVFAENEEGNDEKEGAFTTFPSGEEQEACSNESLRTGLSALLPDCRAYELVTPPDTNGHPPTAGFAGVYFATLRAAPDGNRATFIVEGGTLPGNEGAGGFNGDPYLASRTAEGWSTQLAGPTGDEATGPQPGGVSPDQTYSFWKDIKGPVIHIRYPDGHSELVGVGSLGEDPAVEADLITEGANHIVFATEPSGAVQLEPDAPPAGTSAVYDRSAEGPTHVVSLLPGNEPQKAGENALYLGASEDGEGIVFSIGGTIYVRLQNTETLKVAGPGSTFAGVAEEGKRVFYLESGNLYAFDVETEGKIPFAESGNVTVVNVASDGTRAYFVSPSVLTSEPNPNGEKAKAGKENLYLSEEGAISFVGIVTERDVEGEVRPNDEIDGLGLWLLGLKRKSPDLDPSRTTPAGTTLLFESRADLTNFKSNGIAQVYRYDQTQGRLDCLSCSFTGTPSTSDASLQSISETQFSPEIGGEHLKISNLSPTGGRAFFQTAESLVLGDTDGKLDVYEWEEKGVGSCKKAGGCVYLISSGQSSSPDYLYAVSASGNDVFFRTADQLLARDVESTLSIYDARVDGGFVEPPESIPCAGIDTCQPPPTSPPALPVPGAQTPSEGNVPPQQKNCPKGKHKAKRHGKTVCVKNHKKHHHKAGNKKRGGSQ